MSDTRTSRADPTRHTLRYKVFLGVDIVGSTAFKQPFDASSLEALIASEQRASEWQRAIVTFYETVRLTFFQSWDELQKEIGSEEENSELQPLLFGSPPRVWKTVGDEILFWKQIDHELQLAPLLAAWFAAIDKIRTEFSNKPATKGLDVKATAWTAEFPFRNRTTATGDEDGTDVAASAALLRITDENPRDIIAAYYDASDPHLGAPTGKVDFIGPGIDIGFRIATRSTSKKMAISLDIAYLLSCVGLWFKNSDGKPSASISFPDTLRSGTDHSLRCNAVIQKHWDRIRPFIKNKLSCPVNFSNYRKDDFVTAIGVYFSGTSTLKGALGNVKYPFLWLSTASMATLDSYADTLYIRDGDRKSLGWEELYCFCQKFYDESDRFLHPPLISFDWKRTFSGDEDRVNRYRQMADNIDSRNGL